MTIRTRNLILSIACLLLVGYALRTEGIDPSTRTALISAAFAFLTGLWMHSGRPPGSSSGLAVGLACAAQLAYGCNGGAVSWDGWRTAGGSNTDYVRLTGQGTTPAACASPYGCVFLDTVTGLPLLMDASSNKYYGGQAWRVRSVAGTPGGVAAGDLWYDTSASPTALMFRGSSGSLKILDSNGAFAATTLTIASAPTTATFFKVCTITSAAAATPVVCLAAADVPASLSARLAKWSLYVNGSTGWGTTATCVIEDTSGNDLVSIAVAAMTGDTFVGDHSANVTPAARYRLGTGGAADAGLQISCNANGTGSDAVFVLSGSVQ